MMHQLKAGQVLWHVPSHGSPREMVVESVGRLWAKTRKYGRRLIRINLENLYVMEGDFCCGRCYVSRAEYEESAARETAWDELQRLVTNSYRCPVGLTVERINEARELLGLGKASQ